MRVFDEMAYTPEGAIPLRRTELIGGTLITSGLPARHVEMSQILFTALSAQLDEQEGRVFQRPNVFLDGQNRFIPDVAVVCDPGKIKADGIYGAPDFVIEILVPATELILRASKRTAYERAGVRELWILDAQENTLEVCRFGQHLDASVKRQMDTFCKKPVIPIEKTLEDADKIMGEFSADYKRKSEDNPK